MFDQTVLWAIAVSALAFWLPQNAVHEGSHCLAHKAAGDRITGFWPFPSYSDGSFSFAHMSYVREKPVRPFLDGITSAAPQISNTVILLLLIPLHWADLNEIVRSVFVGVALVNFVDGAVNLSTFYRSVPVKTDGWSFAEAWGLPVWWCRSVTASWQIGMAAHLLMLT